MLFNSYEFIFVFLPAVFAGYWLSYRTRWQSLRLAWLVCASLFFYGWWNPAYVPLLVGSILVNFSIGSYLTSDRRFRKPVLGLGVAANLITLGCFKYANFFVDNLNAATGTTFTLHRIILPLAISFFTFQQIAYLVDAYRREVREHSILRYALFVSFFPQLIAGPIVHHREMMPQYEAAARRAFAWQDVATGLSLFTIGLFKKVVIADGFAPFATAVFTTANAGDAVGSLPAWVGTLAFTFQIYFDFSGYSDMALGGALLFGITLPVNFRSPYKARSIIEFWHRWHMTLSRFLRDYLYVPLGGNRKGPRRRYINLMVTMVLGGLWHGAAWTFVIWGGLHGLYLVVNHGYRRLSEAMGWRPPPLIAGGALTFGCVVVAWVFFRAQDIAQALYLTGRMLDPRGIGRLLGPAAYSPPLDLFAVQGLRLSTFLTLLVLAAVITFALPNSVQYFLDRGTGARFRANLPNLLLVVGCWAVIMASIGGRSEFLYFQF